MVLGLLSERLMCGPGKSGHGVVALRLWELYVLVWSDCLVCKSAIGGTLKSWTIRLSPPPLAHIYAFSVTPLPFLVHFSYREMFDPFADRSVFRWILSCDKENACDRKTLLSSRNERLGKWMLLSVLSVMGSHKQQG